MGNQTGEKNEAAPAFSAGADVIKTPASYFRSENYFESNILFVRYDTLLNRFLVCIEISVVYNKRPEPHKEFRLLVFEGVESLFLYDDSGHNTKKTYADLPANHHGSQTIYSISAKTELNGFRGCVGMGAWGTYKFRFKRVAVQAKYVAFVRKTESGDSLYRDLETGQTVDYYAMFANEC